VLCEKPFTFLNRKHHCRFCGKIFCGDCSAKQICGRRACNTCFDGHGKRTDKGARRAASSLNNNSSQTTKKPNSKNLEEWYKENANNANADEIVFQWAQKEAQQSQILIIPSAKENAKQSQSPKPQSENGNNNTSATTTGDM